MRSQYLSRLGDTGVNRRTPSDSSAFLELPSYGSCTNFNITLEFDSVEEGRSTRLICFRSRRKFQPTSPGSKGERCFLVFVS